MNSETQNIHINATSTVAKPEKLPEKHEEGGLLTINATLVVIVVSFVIFVILMQKIFYGPITEIRRKRSEYIKKMKDEANDAFLETEKLNKDYQENIKQARKKVFEKTAELLNEANEDKNKVLEDKKQQNSEYLDEQKQIIQNDKIQAIEALKGQVMDYAYNISKKVLGEEVSMAGLNPEIVEKAINKAEVR
ncbi:MAG: hypothetical protein A2039_05110 [Candidatus Melainabacteria bacterium GWA2_34_9]|nr:MAG: hypothetical protein A2039_05110 [Candidatus Melainabacteria bacterium GWA2_34_9]